MFVKREAIVFYFEQRARIASWKMIARHPRGSENGSFRRRGARWLYNENTKNLTRAEPGYGQFREPGRSGHNQ